MENHHDKKEVNVPPPEKMGVFVDCDGRTRYAYKDSHGRWRDYHTDELLEGEVNYTPE